VQTFKEFNDALTLDEQEKWVKKHPEEFGEICFTECRKQYEKDGAVLPPSVCFYCKGCPIKTIVVGVSKIH
jgi:hypothetical protein